MQISHGDLLDKFIQNCYFQSLVFLAVPLLRVRFSIPISLMVFVSV